ncbi:52 kda repressor of the inhibitor of the protein kinase [Plakobranchus ocellatus]|uniref:52 kDa repressor of the inhibitor of the protein kinase n=1 Tax=Plakobranchus ocellatus TaxID=259542 RepID=A0AAV4AYZ4_9GAST|nr:52 kda repressor of the inhibitor of the protein kinase [Plakobranchus ocellatus]
MGAFLVIGSCRSEEGSSSQGSWVKFFPVSPISSDALRSFPNVARLIPGGHWTRHVFGRKILMCTKWVINVRRDDLHSKPTEKLCKNNVLCADHFEVSQFMSPALRNKLIHYAVPTVFDIPNKPPSVTPRRPPPKKRCTPISSVHFISEEPIHTEKPQSAKPARKLTPKKVALRKKLHSARQQLHRIKKISEKLHPAEKRNVSLQEINEILSEHLKDKTLDFVMTQTRMASK